MTDYEDGEGDEEGIQPQISESLLEEMCKAHGLEHFIKAERVGNLNEYFQKMRADTEADFKNHGLARRSVNNFLVDSYSFWSRNVEVDGRDRALMLAIRDTMQYLVLLKNDFPFLERAKREDWGYDRHDSSS